MNITATIAELTTIVDFCINHSIKVTEEQVQRILSNIELINKLNKFAGRYHIIHASNISPPPASTKVYIYLAKLDVILSIDKTIMTDFVKTFNGSKVIYFKPTQCNEQQFRLFAKFVLNYKLEVTVSKIVCLQMHTLPQFPDAHEINKIIGGAIDFVKEEHESCFVTEIKTCVNPIFNVTEESINGRIIAKTFEDAEDSVYDDEGEEKHFIIRD
jgi:hypothetical protein